MNIATSFIAIVSLLLALATADTATKQQSEEKSPAAAQMAPSKIALNHNETMVSDAPLAQEANLWSRWVASVQAFFFSRPLPGGCDDWGCGTNHNETMVSDAPLVQDASLWSRWVTSVQAFFFSRPIPGGCDEWGCGTNHNETMVSDAPLAQMNNAESVRQFQPRVALWQPWENGSLEAQL